MKSRQTSSFGTEVHICQLCDAQLDGKNKCKSHILPRAFYKFAYEEDFGKRGKGVGIMATDMENGATKPIPTGVYDDEILCAQCDGRLGALDQYFLNFLKEYKSKMIRFPHGRTPTWAIVGFDQQKLKQFILSYLFRASLSNKHGYAKFNLKKMDLEDIKSILRQEKESDSYTIYCMKFSKQDDGLLFSPLRKRGKRGRKTTYVVSMPNNIAFYVMRKYMKINKYKANGSLGSHKTAFFFAETEDYYETKEFRNQVAPRLDAILRKIDRE